MTDAPLTHIAITCYIPHMEDLLFTVVIPAYNTAPYIEECLDSVVTSAMFCRDAEILVVDDGSTDGTGQILDEYAKKCNILRVIHQKKSRAICSPQHRD